MTTQPEARQPLVLPPIKQESDSHCGPATLQLLYSHLNRIFTQEEIVIAAGIADQILENGMRPAQMARAVAILTPDLQFLFKPNASREDLHQLVGGYRYPVAVNWQGLFYTSAEEELDSQSEDRGHYSVVTDVDLDRNKVVIADPYFEFSATPRIFSLSWFENRWWDFVQDLNPVTGVEETLNTHQLLFIIAPKTVVFTSELGLLLPSELEKLKR